MQLRVQLKSLPWVLQHLNEDEGESSKCYKKSVEAPERLCFIFFSAPFVYDSLCSASPLECRLGSSASRPPNHSQEFHPPHPFALCPAIPIGVHGTTIFCKPKIYKPSGFPFFSSAKHGKSIFF